MQWNSFTVYLTMFTNCWTRFGYSMQMDGRNSLSNNPSMAIRTLDLMATGHSSTTIRAIMARVTRIWAWWCSRTMVSRTQRQTCNLCLPWATNSIRCIRLSNLTWTTLWCSTRCSTLTNRCNILIAVCAHPCCPNSRTIRTLTTVIWATWVIIRLVHNLTYHISTRDTIATIHSTWVQAIRVKMTRVAQERFLTWPWCKVIIVVVSTKATTHTNSNNTNILADQVRSTMRRPLT